MLEPPYVQLFFIYNNFGFGNLSIYNNNVKNSLFVQEETNIVEFNN